MVYTGQVKPINKIVVAGDPLVQELKVENATNMYPGRLVKKGTADDDIVVGTNTVGNDTVGWLGYEQTAPSMRPDTVDTIYEVNAQAAVLSGGGFIIVGRLNESQTITKGESLTSAAAGMLTTSDVTAENVVAVAEESVTTAGGAYADIMVRSVI